MIDQWKLVPIEPTQAMMDAGLYQSSHDSTSADVHSIWKDMVALAPTQGADARPVAIYQVEQAPGRWTNVSRETFDAWAFGKQIVYATRDAAPSDRQDAERYRAIRTISVAEMTWPSDSEFDAYIDETIDSAPREAT